METDAFIPCNNIIKTKINSPNSSLYLSTDPNNNLKYNQNFRSQNAQFYATRNRNKNSSSQIYDILSNDSNWGQKIKQYNEEKRNPCFAIKNPTINIISPNNVKTMETFFNPITQRYRDPKIQKKIEENENKELIKKLAIYYDKELSNTQAFDIINLKDKLKYLGNKKIYPKENKSNNYISKRNYSMQNYNILSNLSLKEHHYDKPENRKNLPSDVKNKSYQKKTKTSQMENRDYNIISNKYNFFDKEKKQVDEMCALQTARNFLTERNYDIIKGVYYDPEKEKKYQKSLSTLNEKLRTAKRDSLFNPFTNVVYDKENLKIKDMLNKNAKLRYSLRYKIEKHYHQKDLKKFAKNDKKLEKKLFYDRFDLIDKRGYNLLNNECNSNNYKDIVKCKIKKSPWEIIQLGSDKKNETISIKGVYKSMYDKSDVDNESYEFKLKREKMLKNLVPFSEDNLFNTVREVNKKTKSITNYKNSKQNLKINDGKYFTTDKKTWFSKDKNVNMRNSK